MDEARGQFRRGSRPISGDIEKVEEFKEVFMKAMGPEGGVLKKNVEDIAVQLRVVSWLSSCSNSWRR
jgi:hypothetical protein